MSEVVIPKPSIKARAVDPTVEQQAKSNGLHPILARVLAARPLPTAVSALEFMQLSLKNLDAPWLMADMDLAAERLAQAICQEEVIGIETDHDCDGQTSHAVIFEALTQYFRVPPSRIRSYIGHRLTEGYGLSESVAKRILADEPKPSIVITADNGSSDEARIALLKQQGIDVIVSDHHGIPAEGFPLSAYACLNPTREDCQYPDPLIAGCMVAWLLMAATRRKLIEKCYLNADAPSLARCLDYVAVGTVADCVSIARSTNNRAVIQYGLRLIEQGTRPCWRAIKPLIRGRLCSEDLGFVVGPLLNSDGRLNDAFGSVSFLLAKTDKEASEWVNVLQAQNEERKQIQGQITAAGLKQASQQLQQGKQSLCIYQDDGHTGVHGIAASRIKDKYGRPTIFLAPKQSDNKILSGSARGIDHFHIRQAFQYIDENYPGLLLSFGGHQGAGGLSIEQARVEEFSQAFERATEQQVQAEHIGPVIWTDGLIEADLLDLALVDQLTDLEPFGREFEAPLFEIHAECVNLKVVGQDQTHAQVELAIPESGLLIQAIWFGMRMNASQPVPNIVGKKIHVVLAAKANEFRGRRSFNPQIQYVELL